MDPRKRSKGSLVNISVSSGFLLRGGGPKGQGIQPLTDAVIFYESSTFHGKEAS